MYTQMDMQTDGWTEDRHTVSHYLSAEHKTEEYAHPDGHADRRMDRGQTYSQSLLECRSSLIPTEL